MIRKINRRNCRKLYPALPISKYQRNQFVYPKVYDQYVLTLPSRSARGHAKNIALCLQKLIKGMGIDKMIFMGDTALPWLYRQSDYKPAKEAVEYLVTNKLSKTFDGGLAVDTADINPFFKHLFWLARTNTVLPYVYGIDEGQHVIVNVCQYGGVHFDTLDEKTDKLFNKHFASSGFVFREGNNCYEPFGKGGSIAGRTLTIG